MFLPRLGLASLLARCWGLSSGMFWGQFWYCTVLLLEREMLSILGFCIFMGSTFASLLSFFGWILYIRLSHQIDVVYLFSGLWPGSALPSLSLFSSCGLPAGTNALHMLSRPAPHDPEGWFLPFSFFGFFLFFFFLVNTALPV